MSAPKTNLEKQKTRHWGPLTGILAALLVVGVLFLAFLYYTMDTDTAEAPAPDTQAETEPAPEAPLIDPETSDDAIELAPQPEPGIAE